MNYIISESQLESHKYNKLKEFIKRKLGVDYTGKIKEIVSAYDLSDDFDGCESYRYLNQRLNKFGPMYLINLKDGSDMLYQKGDKFNLILSSDCLYYDEEELLNMLGIHMIGLSMDDFFKLYLE